MEPQTPNLLEHVKDDTIIKWVGGIIAALWSSLMIVIGALYHRDQKKFAAIFLWKDKVVDPALRDLPKVYVLQKSCDRRHDELIKEIRDSRDEDRKERRHLRGLLEKHLGVDGSGAGP